MTGTSRRSSPTPHPSHFPSEGDPTESRACTGGVREITHTTWFPESEEVGTFLSVQRTWWQTVYRKALPRVCLWYAGYAIWITGCKIPSKEASWSQRCEAKPIHKEMSFWQPQCDQENYFSIHGPIDWNYRGEIHTCFSLFFLCASAGGLPSMSWWVLFWGPWLWLVGVNTG